MYLAVAILLEIYVYPIVQGNTYIVTKYLSCVLSVRKDIM